MPLVDMDQKSTSKSIVILLRPAEQAASMKSNIETLGPRVVLFPTIEIKPCWDDPGLQRALDTFEQMEFCFFTSGNAVRLFSQWMQDQSCSLTGKQVFTVGEATADACRAAGIEVDWTSPVFTVADACTALIRSGLVRGRKGMLPVSKIAADTARLMLQADNVDLLRMDLYDNGPASTSPVVLMKELSAAGKAFCLATSASTVRNLSKLLPENDLQIVKDRVQFLSIGPVTSAAVREEGFQLVAQAKPYSGSALLDALRSVLMRT